MHLANGAGMIEQKGPWHREPDARRARPRLRLWIWLVLLGGLAMALWNLSALFPGALSSSLDQVYFLRVVAVLVVVSSGVAVSGRLRFAEAMRNIALWCAILAMLGLGYTFRTELEDVGMRVLSELVPEYPVGRDARTVAVSAAEDGGFHIMGRANGFPVPFLVDTGASDIVLSPADAARIGIDPAKLDYSHVYETAHGLGRGAITRIARLEVGPLTLSDVDVAVNGTGMRESLLGMAFLRHLDSFSVEKGRLILRGKK